MNVLLGCLLFAAISVSVLIVVHDFQNAPYMVRNVLDFRIMFTSCH